MQASLTIAPIIGLAVSGLGGLIVALYIARRVGRLLNFRTLLILNYIVVINLSGIAHLSDVEDAPRGFYDLLATPSDAGMELATYATFIGLAALCVACLQKLPEKPAPDVSLASPWLVREEKAFIWIMTLVMLPVSLWATLQIQSYVQTLNTDRVIALTDGLARFSYFSNWLAWSISFLTIAFVASGAGKSRFLVLVAAAGAVLGIAATMAWTGGRSVIVVMVLPIVLVLLPKLRGIRWIAIPAAIVAGASYMIAISDKRLASTGGFNLTTWLDWEWGRFSMIGFANQYVSGQGHLFGETFLAGIVSVALGTFRLLGIYIPNPDLQTSTQVSGETLRSSSEVIYIVPGLSAELYLNFGLVGIAVGYYLLGRITNWADRKFLEAPTVLIKLTFAYLGTLLVLRTVAADSGSILSYLMYTGFPLLVAAVWSKVGRRKAAAREEREQRLAEQRVLEDLRALDRQAERKRRRESIQGPPPGSDPIELLKRSATRPRRLLK